MYGKYIEWVCWWRRMTPILGREIKRALDFIMILTVVCNLQFRTYF